MAIIYGTIESLKSLKSLLHSNNIKDFNSVGEIKDFLFHYYSKKNAVLEKIAENLEKKYIFTYTNLEQKIEKKEKILNEERKKIEKDISSSKNNIELINKHIGNNFFKILFFSFKLFSLKKQYKKLEKNKNLILNSAIRELSNSIEIDRIFIKKYENERQNLVEITAKSKIEKLEFTKNVLDKSKNLISGAIGENLVVKEIKKLSDDFVLINDFKLSFQPPIYYKKYNQRIYNIQIDHLLISNAGIFLIETKNWSKASIDSVSLRSPVEQIERANFALYAYLSESISLHGHHWGNQQIPIRNLIIMINHKPKIDFKYVKIKLLNEMNDYINYFEPILSEAQLKKIINKLI